jgi:hypothetical protein
MTHIAGAPKTETGSRPEIAPSRLLHHIFPWSERLVLVLAATFGAIYAIRRSPMSLALSLVLLGVLWPSVRQSRRFYHQDRIKAAIVLISCMLWSIGDSGWVLAQRPGMDVMASSLGGPVGGKAGDRISIRERMLV